MTDRRELIQLQEKARNAGRVAEFTYDKDGWIDSVFYQDPKAPPHAASHLGMTLRPLSFAEIERAKPAGRPRRR